MTRWTGTDYWRAQKRSVEGYVEVKPETRKRGAHKSQYLFHASAYCRSLGIPEPVGEYYFHRDREWRLDLAWPNPDAQAGGIAIEIDGGLHSDGAHNRGARIEADHEKHNSATAAGWRIFRTSPRKLPEVLMLVANTFFR